MDSHSVGEFRGQCYYNDKGYRPQKGCPAKSRQPISSILLSILVGKVCCDLPPYVKGSNLLYGYNTMASCNNPDSISLYELRYKAKQFILSEGYNIHIELLQTKVIVKAYKGDESFITYHKVEYKAMLAMAEIVLREKYKFLPKRNSN